jgi:hypothetical protein
MTFLTSLPLAARHPGVFRFGVVPTTLRTPAWSVLIAVVGTCRARPCSTNARHEPRRAARLTQADGAGYGRRGVHALHGAEHVHAALPPQRVGARRPAPGDGQRDLENGGNQRGSPLQKASVWRVGLGGPRARTQLIVLAAQGPLGSSWAAPLIAWRIGAFPRIGRIRAAVVKPSGSRPIFRPSNQHRPRLILFRPAGRRDIGGCVLLHALPGQATWGAT